MKQELENWTIENNLPKPKYWVTEVNCGGLGILYSALIEVKRHAMRGPVRHTPEQAEIAAAEIMWRDINTVWNIKK